MEFVLFLGAFLLCDCYIKADYQDEDNSFFIGSIMEVVRELYYNRIGKSVKFRLNF